jgi:hypothetical protein
MMKELPFRQIHMDFHTSPYIPGVGSDFDPEEFVRILKEARVNSINLFAKCHHGMYYYPTKIGTMHPSLDFDLFGEQVKACRKEGIRTCVYTTVVWNEDWADKHPEWMQISMDGRIGVKDPYKPGWRWLCSNNEEHKAYLKEEFKEIYDLYKPDGYWIDIILASNCICKACVSEMRQMGLDPASKDDVNMHDRWVQIKFMKEIYAYLMNIDADLAVYFNGHPAEYDLIDNEQYSSLQKRENMTFVDIESLPSDAWGYAHFPMLVNYVNKFDQELAMMNGKFHKSWGDFGSLRNRAALEYECFRAIANGAKCCVGDQLHPTGKIDQSVYHRIGEVYRQIESREEWCSISQKVSQIGVYASNRVLESDMVSDEGVYRILTESHLLYDVIDYTSDIDKYDLVILPDKVQLPDHTAKKLSTYINQGGKVLLTGKSGLNEEGSDFALKEFGVRYVSEDDYSPRYIHITEEVFNDMLPMDYVLYERGEIVNTLDGADVLAYITYPYFNRTYDRFCSHRQTPPAEITDKPGIVRCGNVIYIGSPLFKDYALNGNKAYKDIVINCIGLLLDKPIIKAKLPSTAEATLRMQGDRYILHLLHYIPHRRCKNLDTIEDRIPLYNSSVSVYIDKEPNSVYLAPQREALDFTYQDGYTQIVVPKVDGHQMVVFEF